MPFPRRRAYGHYAYADVERFLRERGMRLRPGGRQIAASYRIAGGRYIVTRPTRGGYYWCMGFRDLAGVVEFIRAFFAEVLEPATPPPPAPVTSGEATAGDLSWATVGGTTGGLYPVGTSSGRYPPERG
jgi:hypothetical protein